MGSSKTCLTPRMPFQLQSFFRTAVSQDEITTIKRLIKHQRELINLDASNDEGICAIHQCSIDGNKKMMSVLLHAGADINAVDSKGWTSLHACAAAGNLELIEYLLRKGADPLKRTDNKELPIDLSIEPSITYSLADFMKAQGFHGLAQLYTSQMTNELQQRKRRNSSVLDTRNPFRGPNSILKKRMSMDTTSTNNKSLLSPSYSRRLSSPSSFNRKLSMSYNRNSLNSCSSYSSEDSEADSEGSCKRLSSGRLSVQFSTNTLFVNYVHENEHEMLDMLLQDEDVSILNKLDRKGLSTIHWAAINGFHECVSIMAKHGADVDIIDPNGWTPLHAAAITNNVECVKELLKNNANICALTNSGESVFDLTANDTILQILKNNMWSNVNAKKNKTTSV